MTSVDPTVVRGVELVDRERPVDVRTYAERGTLVIGFLAPGVRLQLDEAKRLRAAIDVHIQRMEIFTATHRPQVGPART